MTTNISDGVRPGHFGDYLRLARKARSLSVLEAVARLGFVPDDLRNLESCARAGASRETLITIASLYGLPRAEVLSAAGYVPCSLAEGQHLAVGSGPECCSCGWLLREHSAANLADALYRCSHVQWHHPREQAHRVDPWSEPIDAADSPAASSQRGISSTPSASARVRRPLIDLMRVLS